MPDKASAMQAFNDTYTELREFIAALPPEKLDAPSPNPGWTNRQLAAHVAASSGNLIAMAAPRLARGKPLAPLPMPNFLFSALGNFMNGRTAKKFKAAAVGDLLAAMDAGHEEARKALDAVPADGWSRKANAGPFGRQDLAEFVEEVAKHDREHAEDLKGTTSA